MADEREKAISTSKKENKELTENTCLSDLLSFIHQRNQRDVQLFVCSDRRSRFWLVGGILFNFQSVHSHSLSPRSYSNLN